MAIDEGMVSLLSGEVTINALLASTTSVFVDAIEQDYPMSYVSVTVLNTDPMVTLGGTTGMRTSEIDIDCVCTSRVKSNTLADSVDAFIKDYTGVAGSHTIDAVVLGNRAYDVIYTKQGTDNQKYITTLSVSIQHDG